MKRLYSTIIVLGAFALVAACTKENTEPVAGEDCQISFSVSLPEQLKTSMGSKSDGVYPVTWSEGDVIYVNGVASEPLSKARSGQPTAVFDFSSSIKPPYNVTYCGMEDFDDLVSIPSTQITTVPQKATDSYSISFKSNTLPMTGSSTSVTDIALHHAGAVLLVPLKGDVAGRQIRHITFTALGNEALAGTFRLGRTGGVFNGTIEPVAKAVTMSLACTTGYTTLNTTESRVYCAVVAPGTYSEGIGVEVVASDGAVMRLNACRGSSLTAGTVYEFDEQTFAEQDKYDVVIQNETQLKDFRKRVDEGEKMLSATLVKDVTVATPASTWASPLDGYCGEFNGGGHTIKGLDGPMFNELFGTVRDLVLESNFEVTLPDRDTMWTAILARRGTDGCLISGCTVKGSISVSSPSPTGNVYAAGICGYCPKGTIKGCRNEATVSASVVEKDLYVGGIVGRTYSSASDILVCDCVNLGTISASGTPVALRLGGVIGIAAANKDNGYPDAVVKNCTNLGTVIMGAGCTPSSASTIGGVVGYSYNPVENCINEGRLEYSSELSIDVMAGGVVGEVNNTVSGLVNDGYVISRGKSSSMRLGGVVGHVDSKCSGITDCRSGARACVLADGVVTTSAAGISISGVVGYSSVKCELLRCVNEGRVELKDYAPVNASRVDFGGVIGFHSNASGNLVFNECFNRGALVVNGALGKTSETAPASIGGIAGLLNKNDATPGFGISFSGCGNSGTISVDGGTTGSKHVLLGGIVASATAPTLRVENSSNSGDITFRGSSEALTIGGIASLIGSGSVAKIDINAAFEGCTNTGAIFLDESTATAQNRAGGIIGATKSSEGHPLILSVSGCTNGGSIDRRVVTTSTKESFAGGIIGALGYSRGAYKNSTNKACSAVYATIDECVNTAMIRFNQVSSDRADDAAEANDSYSYTGGITGLANTIEKPFGIVITSCTNSGNMYSTCGRHGGIVGIANANVKISGIATKYTVNSGRVITRSDGAWNGAPTSPNLYSGGIVGNIQIDGNYPSDVEALIEYCWNFGSVAGSTVAGGILGAVNSNDNSRTTVRYCKNSGLVQTVKNKGTRGFSIVGGFANVMKSLSDCAAGGSVAKHTATNSSTVAPTVLSADNYWQHVARGASSVLLFNTEEDAQAAGVAYWDGTSATSWE